MQMWSRHPRTGGRNILDGTFVDWNAPNKSRHTKLGIDGCVTCAHQQMNSADSFPTVLQIATAEYMGYWCISSIKFV